MLVRILKSVGALVSNSLMNFPHVNLESSERGMARNRGKLRETLSGQLLANFTTLVADYICEDAEYSFPH